MSPQSPTEVGGGSPQLLCRCCPVPGPQSPTLTFLPTARGSLSRGLAGRAVLTMPGSPPRRCPPPDILCDERRGRQECGLLPSRPGSTRGWLSTREELPAGSLRVLWARRSEPLSYRSRWASLERCGSRGSGLLGGWGSLRLDVLTEEGSGWQPAEAGTRGCGQGGGQLSGNRSLVLGMERLPFR